MTILSGAVYNYACMILPPQPGNYFEIGVFNGTGFSRIAKENPTKQCYAIDPFIEDGHTVASSSVQKGHSLNAQKQNFLNNIKDLTNVTYYEMTSLEYLQTMPDKQYEEMNISIVTIDGDHHYDNVKIDFNIAIKLIGNKEGQIIVDDIDVVGVKKAYDEFLEDYATRINKEIDAGGATKVILIKQVNE